MRDTNTEGAAVQLDAFRRLSPAQRVALAFEASDWLLAVARARAPQPVGAPSLADAAAVAPTAVEPTAVREPQAR